MPVINEKHYCKCPPEIVHVGGHWKECCSCIKCDFCKKWVQTRYWALHQSPGGCPHRSGQIPKPSSQDPLPSVEQALIDLEGVEAYNQKFCASVKQCLGELISYFAENSSGWYEPPNRTEAWKKVLETLLSDKSDEDRVKALLELFEEKERTDELEAHLLFLLIMVDKNNPNPLGC